ncbi:NnrS family protein [Pseudoduganella eburnea]|uniref:NnrS family protein n=1 Tax=Massilia eburnea TaxID=1776165 RepID=A0A6L6QMH5_9BURK|nr:NnrS family protein [Massilia eburnea]MTW13370.1 NnrS family protein [Massilia eburnea]
MRSIHLPTEPTPIGQPHPLLRLGFRPFYLLAAALAALSVPLWLAGYRGALPALPAVNMLWHMHEMVFGFAGAVIIGFLFTAGRNWTNLPTPAGGQLAALAGLWVAGRAAMLLAPGVPALVIDGLFLPLCALAFGRVLVQAQSKRNYPICGILILLSVANLLFHAAANGWIALSAFKPVHGAILMITVLEAVIGGRVIPMFTRNGAPGSQPVTVAWREKASIALLLATALAWVGGLPGFVVAAVAFAAASVNAVRLAGWAPFATVRVPLLWILHLAYAWIVAGLLLLGFAAVGIGSSSSAFHALAVGGMSGLIIGMITRTALGHTGRMLRAGRAESAMYLLLQAGAVARLCANLLPAEVRDILLAGSALAWAGSFLTYLWVYGPYLSKARVDGREG